MKRYALLLGASSGVEAPGGICESGGTHPSRMRGSASLLRSVMRAGDRAFISLFASSRRAVQIQSRWKLIGMIAERVESMKGGCLLSPGPGRSKVKVK